MSVTLDLTQEEIAQIKDLTKQVDDAQAVSLAAREFLRRRAMPEGTKCGSAARPWQLQCLEQLNAVKALSQNWDGYHSPPVSDAAYQQACQLISAVEVDQLSAPHVGPESGGAVQIDWQQGARSLELHFLADGSVATLQIECDQMISESELPPGAIQAWRSLFDWLQAGERTVV